MQTVCIEMENFNIIQSRMGSPNLKIGLTEVNQIKGVKNNMHMNIYINEHTLIYIHNIHSTYIHNIHSQLCTP